MTSMAWTTWTGKIGRKLLARSFRVQNEHEEVQRRKGGGAGKISLQFYGRDGKSMKNCSRWLAVKISMQGVQIYV